MDRVFRVLRAEMRWGGSTFSEYYGGYCIPVTKSTTHKNLNIALRVRT